MLLPILMPGPERTVYRDRTVEVKLPKAEDRYTANASDISVIYASGVDALAPIAERYLPTYKAWTRLKMVAVDKLDDRTDEDEIVTVVEPDREKWGIFAGWFSPKKVERRRLAVTDHYGVIYRMQARMRILETTCAYDLVDDSLRRFKAEAQRLAIADTVDLTGETITTLGKIKDGTLAELYERGCAALEKQVQAAERGEPAWLGFLPL